VLNAEAKEEWRRVAPLLVKAGVLTTIDRSALAAYCASFARWQAAERQLASSDLVIRTARGGHVANPLLRIAAKAQSDTVKFASEFGMSPASRTRVRVNNDKQARPEDSFFPDAS
jgi:P27 family predicted phage terminase small subunit